MLKKFVALAVGVSMLAGAQAAPPLAREHRLTGSQPARPSHPPHLLLREQSPATGDRTHPVLYIHGATFPSATAIMFRFEGSSWADSLNEKGWDVFGLDFAGYGGSERYLSMTDGSPNAGAALGRAPEAAEQIERAVRFILSETGAKRVSIIAHSWGTIVAGRFAGLHPEIVGRLVLFGPIAERNLPRSDEEETPWQYVTVAQQHARFIRDVPAGHPQVLVERDFPRWAETYLDSDPTSRERKPPSVQTPAGPGADVADAWSGHLPYDPSRVTAPTLLIRGEWDSSSTDADIAWLEKSLSRSPLVLDVKVRRATHLMHLEAGRKELYAKAHPNARRIQ